MGQLLFRMTKMLSGIKRKFKKKNRFSTFQCHPSDYIYKFEIKQQYFCVFSVVLYDTGFCNRSNYQYFTRALLTFLHSHGVLEKLFWCNFLSHDYKNSIWSKIAPECLLSQMTLAKIPMLGQKHFTHHKKWSAVLSQYVYTAMSTITQLCPVDRFKVLLTF